MNEGKDFAVVSQMAFQELSHAAVLLVVTQGSLNLRLVEGFDARIWCLRGLGETLGWCTPLPGAVPLTPQHSCLLCRYSI